MPVDGEAAARRTRERVLRRLVAILVAIAVVWLLRAAAIVFMPLAFAVFLIALFWPLQRRLVRHMPRAAAMLITLLVFLAVAALFGWALYQTLATAAQQAPEYGDRLSVALGRLREGLGLPPPEGNTFDRRLQDFLVAQSRAIPSLIGGAILVVAYFVLGLLEVGDFRRKLDIATESGRHRHWREPVHRIAADFQRYMVVRTGVGLATGVLSGLAAFAIGLDFALLWGVLNFLLNYIPTLGSILGVVPPVLFALVQGGWTMALLALATIGGVQVIMGVFVDPKLQGRYLRLSPLAVLFSVAVWEWIWGIPGAFIGVPVTVGLVIACSRFESTRRVAILLSDLDENGAPNATQAS